MSCDTGSMQCDISDVEVQLADINKDETKRCLCVILVCMVPNMEYTMYYQANQTVYTIGH